MASAGPIVAQTFINALMDPSQTSPRRTVRSPAATPEPQKGEGFPGQRIVVLPRDVIERSRSHPLLEGLLPTDTGYFPKAAGHRRQREEGIDQAILIYCTRGAGWCELAGVRHEVRPGGLVVIPPLTPHGYGADDRQPWTISWVHAVGSRVPHFLADLRASSMSPVLVLGEETGLPALFEELLDVLEQGYTPAQLVYAAQILGHALGAMIWRRQQGWRGPADPSRKVSETVEFMKQHLDRPLRVERLAALASLSASHYTMLFKRHTGYAPMEYLIRLRIHRACQLLDTTGVSIKAVAAAVGYEDPLYFSRVFRAVNEVSPQQYRELHKG